MYGFTERSLTLKKILDNAPLTIVFFIAPLKNLLCDHPIPISVNTNLKWEDTSYFKEILEGLYHGLECGRWGGSEECLPPPQNKHKKNTLFSAPLVLWK